MNESITIPLLDFSLLMGHDTQEIFNQTYFQVSRPIYEQCIQLNTQLYNAINVPVVHLISRQIKNPL
jgi:hypothetical protein